MHSKELINWKSEGNFIKISPFQYKLFYKEFGRSDTLADKTLLLLHGFPESSFSYHKIIAGMKNVFDRIILFDMVGYGWSDKPVEGFTYSLIEQADVALKVWEHLNVTGGHLLGHDMGDSVATELVYRHVNNLMPGWFSEGFKSFSLTNGSMVLEFAELRITQKILLSKRGKWMSRLSTFKVFNHQVNSAQGNNNLTEKDISHLWENLQLQDGHRKTYLTIRYLNDRMRFEKTRWLPALKQVKNPIHICWGNEDAVARVEIAHYLKNTVCPQATLTIMENAGHFCQLGSPEKWVESISHFYKKI